MEHNELQQLEEQVGKGLMEAYRKMVIMKKNNSPLIVSKDGVVVAIPPEEINPTTSAKNQHAYKS